jgi:hypothetical protein
VGAVEENYDETQTTTVKKKIGIKSEADIAVEAKDKILLKCGDSHITILPDKIEIKSKEVLIDGSALAQLQSAKKAEVISDAEAVLGVGTQAVKCNTAEVATCGAAVKTCADGTHTITGTLVKIN